MRSRAQRLSFLFPLILILIHSGVSFGVRDGSTSGVGENKKYFMLYYSKLKTQSSSVNILYPRCLLTTAHGLDIPPDEVRMGFKAKDEPTKKSQIERVEKRDVFKNKDMWTDLGIVVVKKKMADGQIDEANDYEPKSITHEIGMGSVLAKDALATPVNKDLSMGSPVKSWIYGYGANDSDAVGDTGYGVRRFGKVDANRFFLGVLQGVPGAVGERMGSVYYLDNSKDNIVLDIHACDGDSGGPAATTGKDEDKVYGIIVGGRGDEKCSGKSNTVAVGFDKFRPKNAPANSLSNWEWVTKTAEKLCGAKAKAEIPNGGGAIAGNVYPSQLFPYADVDLNDSVHCGTAGADCEEMLHFGQSLSLMAVPDPNFLFDHWADGTEGPCSCSGSNQSNCVIPYDQAGYYDEEATWIAGGSCAAVFSPATPPENPPGVTCSDGSTADFLCTGCGDGTTSASPAGCVLCGNLTGSSPTCHVCTDGTMNPGMCNFCGDGTTSADFFGCQLCGTTTTSSGYCQACTDGTSTVGSCTVCEDGTSTANPGGCVTPETTPIL